MQAEQKNVQDQTLAGALARVAELSALADALHEAAILVDGDGHVLFANRGARELLMDDRGIAIRGGRIRAARAADAEAIARGIRTAATGDRDMVAIRRRGQTEGAMVLSVLPLGEPSETAAVERRAAAVVVLHASRTVVDERTLRTAAGLTPSEAGLAAALLRGLTVNDYASETGLTIETVRTYVKRVRAKMGARTQADLVRRLRDLVPL